MVERMNKTRVLAVSFLLLILLLGARIAFAEEGQTIHPFDHNTTTSYTSPPGKKIGCLTSCTNYTLYIDFYYLDTADQDQRITSLFFQTQSGDSVPFSVTWEYSNDGGLTWTSYSGTGDIDVPWSGKKAVGQLDGTEPHTIVRVTWHVTGDIGDKFYYRVHFRSFKYGGEKPGPGNAGNHYFWYEICGPTVPEFALGPEVVAGLGLLALYALRHRRKP